MSGLNGKKSLIFPIETKSLSLTCCFFGDLSENKVIFSAAPNDLADYYIDDAKQLNTVK